MRCQSQPTGIGPVIQSQDRGRARCGPSKPNRMSRKLLAAIEGLKYVPRWLSPNPTGGKKTHVGPVGGR